MIVTHKLNMDLLANNMFYQQIHAVQADANTRAVELSLYAGSVPWPVPEDVTVALAYRKPDGAKGLYDTLPDGTAAVTVADNVVTVILAPQVLTAAGEVKATVLLNDADLNQLATFPFMIRVTPNPGAGEVVSNHYFYYTTMDALNQAIGNLDDLETEDKSSLVAAINEAAKTGGNAASGQPTPVTQLSEMEDAEKLYLYMGDEEGMTYGAWYYWSGTQWAVGSAYGIGQQGVQGKGSVITMSRFTKGDALVVGKSGVVLTSTTTDPSTNTVSMDTDYVYDGDGIDGVTVETLESGEEATAELERNTDGSTTLKLGIPKGEDGASGEQVITQEYINCNKFRLHQLGELYTPPSDYVAWGGSMLYEKRMGKFVQWLYCAPAHIHSTAELYVVYIDKKTMIADEPIHCVYYDSDGTTQLSFDNEAGITVRTLEDGTYQLIKSIKNGTETNFFRFNSSDYGQTWVKGEQISPPSGVGGFDGIVELSNGRLITSYGGPVFYSDDVGETWTISTPETAGGDYEAEAFFCELKPGTVMAIARYTKSGGSAGDGTPDPAIIAYSYDYGTTWTAWKESSTILDMNAIGCSGIMHDGFLELFVMTRWYEGIDAHTETGRWGAVYQYTASVEDALNDNFTSLGVVYYSKAAYAQDFLSPDFAIDDDGDMLFSVADGDESVADICAKIYAKGTKTGFFATVDDDHSSTFGAYSSKKIDKLLAELNSTILTLQYALSQIEGSGITEPDVPENTIMWTKVYNAEDGAIADSVLAEYATGLMTSDTAGQDSLGNDARMLKNYDFVFPLTKNNCAVEVTETWENGWTNYNHVGIVIDADLNLYYVNTYAALGVTNASFSWDKMLYDFSETPSVITKRIVKRGDAVTCTVAINGEVVVEDYDMTQHTLHNAANFSSSAYQRITGMCAYLIPGGGSVPVHSIKFGEWD